MLLSRSPAIQDVNSVGPDMLITIALTDGVQFERSPVEVIGVRNNPRIYVCRMLSASSILQVNRGEVIHVLEHEILGIERGVKLNELR